MVAVFNIILEFAMASPIADSQTHNADWQSCLIQTLSEPIAECHVLKAVEIVAEVDSVKDTMVNKRPPIAFPSTITKPISAFIAYLLLLTLNDTIPIWMDSRHNGNTDTGI